MNYSSSPSPDEGDLLSSPVLSSDEKRVEDLAAELAEQQERLLQLKRQQDEVEARKRELEELSRRRTELSEGQKLMRDKLSRALTVLERAEYDAQKDMEQIRLTRDSFTEHFESLQSINPKDWEPDEVDDELTTALAIVDNAEAVYSQARARIDALSGQDLDEFDAEMDRGAEDGADLPFGELVRRGFALTLPLLILLSVIAFLIFIKA
ncbi:MAG: hypothetical protein AAFY98_03120 [Verrucomicrobiota bacterium]